MYTHIIMHIHKCTHAHAYIHTHTHTLTRESIEVAVKTLESGLTKEDRIKFLQEATIMGQFDHPNILSILAIIKNDPVSSCNACVC